MDKGDEKVRALINTDTKRFADIIVKFVKDKITKWDDIVIAFEWTFEADKIKELIEKNSCLDST